ncbi:hypothetical protein GF108_08035 [Phyllobacterium sp. SYP-B3895]|uniref:rhamnosyltransferase WsaF family glycosyltransferase n=1 Tax=Phyllobacterium sp. SYP-B3895 TaxID=2663240 RepID=UPI001299747D|nr:methyltransferase domain-containing protein [Phyllobacterium sp. SYP-B3895]MRG55530.1 hypothetical protein [Phyllobacterium sp. SYP-B3895]
MFQKHTAGLYQQERRELEIALNAYERAEPRLSFYAGIVEHIIRSLGPRTVLDAGCAAGMIVQSFWDRGIRAEGIDIVERAIKNVRPDMREHCRIGSLTERLSSKYDLIVCLDVLDQIPTEEVSLAIADLAASTETVLFSSSPHGLDIPHINVRPSLSWMRLFGEHGLRPDLVYDASYISPHAILFRRGEPVEDDLLTLMSEHLRLRHLIGQEKQAMHDEKNRRSEAEREAKKLRDELRTAQERARDLEGSYQQRIQQLEETNLKQIVDIDSGIVDERMRLASEIALMKAQNQRFRDACMLELSQAGELYDRLNAIETSTSWLATMPARRAASHLPEPIRAGVRRLVRRKHVKAKPHRNQISIVERPGHALLSQLTDAPASEISFGPNHIETQVEIILPQGNQIAIEVAIPQTLARPSARSLISQQFPDLAPLPVFRDRATAPTLTILTDSVESNSLFGGVGTSLIVGALVAKRLSARLRLVTRTAAPDPSVMGSILQAHGIGFDGDTDYVHMPIGTDTPLPLGTNDLILTISWWGTRSVLGSVHPRQILYLLQEDERMFYCHGDLRLRCAETLAEPELRVLVNTSVLFDHLAGGKDPVPTIGQRGYSFEPAFPAIPRPRATAPRLGKKNFFFYARPNHARNLYWRGLEVVETILRKGLLSPSDWNIHFVGHELPEMELPAGVKPQVWSKLPWSKYAELVSDMDLGLSLMDTPHPSYPPLDLAAAGAIVVTNTCGPKTSLEHWSRNIISVPPTVSDLVAGVRQGLDRVDDREKRLENCWSDNIPRDWEKTLGPILDRLLGSERR